MYAVRIHKDVLGSDWLTRLLNVLSSNVKAYVFASETEASREHLQGWVDTDISEYTLRARVKRAFPEVVGNKGYSIKKVKNEEAYKLYVLKGTKDTIADIVCSMSLDVSEEALKTAHTKYWATHKKDSLSKCGIVQEVYEWALSQEGCSRRDIIIETLNLITSRNKPLMMHYVKGVVNSVEYRLNLQDREKFIEALMYV